MIFLAHFAPGLGSPLEMTLEEISWWFNEAYKLHKEMNTVKE